MMTLKDTDVTVIGPGAVGSPLVMALSGAGYSIRSICTRRDPARYPELLKRLGLPGQISVLSPEALDSSNIGTIILISVPDDRIQPVALTLEKLPLQWKNRVVAHCSGIHHSGLLDSLKERGAKIAAFHPIQTFTGDDTADIFSDIQISVEGESEAVEVLMAMAGDIGAIPFRINRKQKSMLHLAAVFLSNYLVVLGGISDRMIQSSIPDKDLRILNPLLKKTAENLTRNSPSDVLTGPVSRGDFSTIKKHLEIMSDEPELLDLYKKLGLQACRLTNRKKDQIETDMKKIERLLSSEL